MAAPELDRLPAADLNVVQSERYFGLTDARSIGGFVEQLVNGVTTMDACPSVTVTGNTRTVRGGCSRTEGTTTTTFSGSVTIVTESDGTIRTTLDNFGTSAVQPCMGSSAGMTVTANSSGSGTYVVVPSRGTFETDVRLTGATVNTTMCTSTPVSIAALYSGSFSRTGPDANGDGRPDQEVWNGSGRIGIGTIGTWQTTTRDERWDPAVCPREPVGGTIEARSGSNVAIVTYDGASSCQREGSPTAPWTLNGVAQESQTRVTACSAGPLAAGARGGVIALAALSAAVTAVRARRRRA